MATLDIQRANPTGVPADDNPATAVPLAADDRAIIVLGTKMFGASDTGYISRSEQMSRIGTRSNGRFGSTDRRLPSHGQTIIVGFDVVTVPEETANRFDQFLKDQLADLVYRKLLIVSVAGVRMTPDQVRTMA